MSGIVEWNNEGAWELVLEPVTPKLYHVTLLETLLSNFIKWA